MSGGLYYILTIHGPDAGGKYHVHDKSDSSNVVVTEHATLEKANAEWARRAKIIQNAKTDKSQKPRAK